MLLTVGLVACGSGGGGDDASAREPDPSPGPTSTTTTSTVPSPTAAPDPGTTVDALVVVDPGHNGANGRHPEIINQPVDAGGFDKACNTTGAATDGGVSESSINWAVAQLVRDRLTAHGVRVIMTRDDDDGAGPCIDERGQIAARNGADLLLSIHADGAPAAGHGFHVIHPAVLAGYTDATVAPSAALATDLRDALTAAGFIPSTYVGDQGLDERDDLGTLNRAGVPAAMVEMGNLRNPADATQLTSPTGQAALADALVAGVLGHLQRDGT